MLNVAQTAQRLQSFDQVLILTHVRPDGDTVGCAAALCIALRKLGKTAYLLPNSELTKNSEPYFKPFEAPDGFVPRFVVSTDIATPDLFPENAKPYLGCIDLAIDHHPSFEAFGKENIVRSEAAACGELVYDILTHLCPITQEIALPLYVAVSTDTGCFQYSNTTAYTHQVAAALMATGIDYRSVNKVFFRTKTRKRLALEADMLSKMEFFDRGRVVILTVPISLMERVQADENDAEDLSSLGGQIEGTDCAITMRELRKDVWKMSVRTGPRVNATKVCALLGGGGHAAAAGCTVEAPLADVKRHMLQAVAQVAGDYDDGRSANGILVINKPAGWTSMDVCAKIRGILHEKRVGHAGTLDPMATGVLPVFVGQATKAVSFAENSRKEYLAGLRLGIVTDTQDTTGTVLETHRVAVTPDELEAAMSKFTGDMMQLPPMYSAVKVNGQKLYELARKGQEIERKPRPVTIHSLELVRQVNDTDYFLRCVCSKGTYIRTLCHDLGQALGCGGVMYSLQRTMAAGFSLAQTVTLEEVQSRGKSLLLPLDSFFSSAAPYPLSSQEQESRVRNGNPIQVPSLADGTYRVYSCDGTFLCLSKAFGGTLTSVKNFFERKD